MIMAQWSLTKAEIARQQGRYEEAKAHTAQSIRLNETNFGHWVTASRG